MRYLRGRDQFSILHPCFVPPHRKVLRNAKGVVRAVEVGGYFNENDGHIETWWFSTLPREERDAAAPFRVPHFHRTLNSWVAMISQAGFVIQQFGEPCATRSCPIGSCRRGHANSRAVSPSPGGQAEDAYLMNGFLAGKEKTRQPHLTFGGISQPRLIRGQ